MASIVCRGDCHAVACPSALRCMQADTSGNCAGKAVAKQAEMEAFRLQYAACGNVTCKDSN
ncbi:MAG: hypothetical protein ACI3X7_00740 [Bacteroidaceae bacterium]